jgi:hypothetical protein
LKEQRRDLVVALMGHQRPVASRMITQIAAIQQTIAAIEAVITDLDAEIIDHAGKGGRPDQVRHTIEKCKGRVHRNSQMTAKQLSSKNIAPLPPTQLQSAMRSTVTGAVFNTSATFAKIGAVLLGLIIAKHLVTAILTVLAFAIVGSVN